MGDIGTDIVTLARLGDSDPAALCAMLQRLGCATRLVDAPADGLQRGGHRLLWIDRADDLAALLPALMPEFAGAASGVIVICPQDEIDAVEALGCPIQWDLLGWPCAEAVLAQAPRRIARSAFERVDPNAALARATLERAIAAGLVRPWQWAPGARDPRAGTGEPAPLDQIHPDDHERVRAGLRDALAHGERLSIICRLADDSIGSRRALLLAAPTEDVGMRGLQVPGFTVLLSAGTEDAPGRGDAQARLQDTHVSVVVLRGTRSLRDRWCGADRLRHPPAVPARAACARPPR
jgi:hypothetical protein